MQKKIQDELRRLNWIENQMYEMIKNAPDEKLRCENSKGYYQYYVGKKYLGKEKRDYVKQIAQKEYCVKLEKELVEYRQALRALQEIYQRRGAEKIYQNLYPGKKQLVSPLVRPIEDIIEEFENLEYERKEFEKENTTEFYTTKGERVRSKSEKIIGDELYRYGVPYKYEMPLELESWGKKVILYPDFTALNCRTGKRWILEHLGMMDKPSYYENAMFRVDILEKNNILIGDRLILFHETSTHPININIVRKYIEMYLL